MKDCLGGRGKKITSHQKQLYDHFVTFTVTSWLLHWPHNNRAHFCDFTLQHADSEGALLGERCPPQTASSASTLASGLDEPQAVSQCASDLSPGRDSQEPCSADADTKVGSSFSEGGLELEEAKGEKVQEEEEDDEGDSYKEDALFGDDQVADFASSVLAAISCWQFKARALLSTHITTVRVSHFLLHSTGSPSPPPLFFPIGYLILSHTNRTF